LPPPVRTTTPLLIKIHPFYISVACPCYRY
jgi:hypothetical protein